MSLNTVILDWSGTLADDLDPVIEASNLVLRDFGGPQLSRVEFQKRFRLPFDGFWKELLPGVTLGDLEASYHQHFAPIQHRVKLLPGARDFLEACCRSGLRTVLLSTIHPEHFEAQSAALGVRQLFAELCIGVMNKREFLATWLRRREIRPEEAVFLGDMAHDIEAGKAAGVLAVGVLGGFDPPEKLLAAGPDVVLSSIGVAPRLFASALRLNALPTATVGALIGNGEGKFLLIRTRKWGDRWGIPGGKVEPNETSEAALLREVKEETGLTVTDIRFAMVQDCIRCVEFHRPAHFLLLNYTAKARSGLVTLNDEAEEWIWVTADQARRMNLNQPTRRLIDFCDQTGTLP